MTEQRVIATALQRIKEASEISEREALSVGQLLGKIMEVAQRQHASLENSLDQFSDSSEGSIRQVAAAQSEAIANYLARLSSLINEQLELTKLAALQCEQISKAGSTIEQATIEARILSLNARITAAQNNSGGAAFAAIASEMQALSQTITQANALVGTLATELNKQLPLIARQAAAMGEENSRFSGILHGHISRVEETTRKLEGTLRDTIYSGSAHYAQILRASQRAVSHLQYQDPMVQRLRRTCLELESIVRPEGAEGNEENPPAQTAEAMAAEAVSAESDMEPGGEVLLF